MDIAAERFVDWFKTHGTQHAALGLADFPGMGRGAIALDDIPVCASALFVKVAKYCELTFSDAQADTVLFSIPRTLLLNTTNSKLQSLLREEEWAALKNWTSLILTMMWESRQEHSLWKPYFNIMPVQFDSLMFWTDEELKELEGCAVLCEIFRHLHQMQ